MRIPKFIPKNIATKELYNLKGYNIDKTFRKQLWKGQLNQLCWIVSVDCQHSSLITRDTINSKTRWGLLYEETVFACMCINTCVCHAMTQYTSKASWKAKHQTASWRAVSLSNILLTIIKGELNYNCYQNHPYCYGQSHNNMWWSIKNLFISITRPLWTSKLQNRHIE